MAYVSRSSEQASIFPANNLPSDSKLWGQDIEKRLFNIENNFKAAEVNNLTRDSQLISNFNRLDVAVTNINNILDDLGLLNNDVFGPGGLEEAIANVTGVVIDETDPTKINGLNLKVGTVLADNVVSTYVYAGEISADKVTAGTIDANEITITNINASNITSGTIDATDVSIINLNASNITSGTIDATDVNVINIDADNIIGGTITGTTIQTSGPSRVIMNNSDNSLKFTNGATTVANIFPGTSDLGEPGIYMSYSEVPDIAAQNYIKLTDQGFALRAGVGGVISGYGGSISIAGSAGISLDAATVAATSNITAAGNIMTTGTGFVRTADIRRTSTNGQIKFSTTAGASVAYIDTSTALSTGTQIYANGIVSANSFTTRSSRRFKANIEPYQIPEDSILDLEVVKYQINPKSLGIYAEDGSELPLDEPQIGLIAEDVAQTSFKHLVSFNDSDPSIAEGIDYSKIVVLLIPEIKALRDQVKDLTARLEALEG